MLLYKIASTAESSQKQAGGENLTTVIVLPSKHIFAGFHEGTKQVLGSGTCPKDASVEPILDLEL